MSANDQLSGEVLDFIEGFGLHIQDTGLPRSVGRVLGFLLICQPEHQSAEQIQEKLQLSTGSVNTATTLLRRLGLIKRTTFPSDRHHYYEVDIDCWQQLIDARIRQFTNGLKIASDGLKIRKDDPRLVGMHYIYQEFLRFSQELTIGYR